MSNDQECRSLTVRSFFREFVEAAKTAGVEVRVASFEERDGESLTLEMFLVCEVSDGEAAGET